MLEKIGLPPKPSMRGNSWVVDASHCQGCSSQFTFINRKHHCRRCGGIFCSSCTQQRMVLRGQGDSPVRICEPCKKLEEDARFELRYGRKSRDAKVISKYSSNKDGEILKDILGDDDKLSSTEKNITSCSYTPSVEDDDIIQNELESNTTPDDLRQQALVEKQKYRTLKSEGKPEEALRAFKRGKELERRAAALELSLRKRKRAFSSSNLNGNQQIKDEFKAPDDKNYKLLPVKNRKAADDLFTELKDLGWSDQDLRDSQKKSAALSVEGELSSLLKEVSQKPIKEKPTVSSDKSRVIAHKKRALELKRAGNLVEAKEELKRAKILERKIEEEELLGEVDDSDDELSSLIQSMDDDKDDRDFINFDIGQFTGISDDLALDGNFEVTDDDMYDPEINSALESLGWVEDNTDRESVLTEIRILKREALNRKNSGNSAEAMSLLKKAKLLEKEVEISDTRENQEPLDTGLKVTPKSKHSIQKELIALKKKALTLRREGKLEESAEELKMARVLEEQLEDMNKAPPLAHPNIVNEDEEDVTDRDLRDPTYLSLLKNLGWGDEDNAEGPSMTSKENNKSTNYINIENAEPRKNKNEIQRELLMLKRKALTLRRQGEAEEADEVLKMAKLLEEKLREFEEPTKIEESPENNMKNAPESTETALAFQVGPHDSRSDDFETQVNEKVTIIPDNSDEIAHEKVRPSLNSIRQEILSYKKKAIAFKREGKLAEAKEALKQAKLIEKTSTEDYGDVAQTKIDNSNVSSADKEASPISVPKPSLSGRDKFKLQQESLGHKREALKLRREGRMAEAEVEFELAKAIESRLQESESSNSSGSAELAGDDVAVEDFLDPQLLSMLQSIGLDDGRASRSRGGERRETVADLAAEDAYEERERLAERIKAEKVKAVNLKRSGKQAEALDALRRAKLYEKKLQALTNK